MKYWQQIHIKQLYVYILKDELYVDECERRQKDIVHIILKHSGKDNQSYISVVLTPRS